MQVENQSAFLKSTAYDIPDKGRITTNNNRVLQSEHSIYEFPDSETEHCHIPKVSKYRLPKSNHEGNFLFMCLFFQLKHNHCPSFSKHYVCKCTILLHAVLYYIIMECLV